MSAEDDERARADVRASLKVMLAAMDAFPPEFLSGVVRCSRDVARETDDIDPERLAEMLTGWTLHKAVVSMHLDRQAQRN